MKQVVVLEIFDEKSVIGVTGSHSWPRLASNHGHFVNLATGVVKGQHQVSQEEPMDVVGRNKTGLAKRF